MQLYEVLYAQYVRRPCKKQLVKEFFNNEKENSFVKMDLLEAINTFHCLRFFLQKHEKLSNRNYKKAFVNIIKEINLTQKSIFNTVKELYPNMIVQQLVDVQPLTYPIGDIFKLKTKYDGENNA